MAADNVLRCLFKPHEYGDVILPFVILRRLDCVIEPMHFQLDKPVEKLHKNNRLFLLIEKFSSVDLHPDVVDNHASGQMQSANCKVQIHESFLHFAFYS